MKLTGRIAGGAASQRVRAVVYADASGNPGALVAVTPEVTIAAAQPAAWVDFPLATPATIAAGRYWIGYWYGATSNAASFACTNGVAGIERYVPDAYSSTGQPNSPWGAGSTSTSEYTLYATFSGG